MPLFQPVFIDQRVALKPSEFREAIADLDGYLLAAMRKGVEGSCNAQGYVKPGSTQILARSMGQAEHCRFTGDYIFYCKVRMDCLMPFDDMMVEAQVLKANKLGAYVLVTEGKQRLEAMRILLPRDMHMGNAIFDGLKVGDHVRVKVLQTRFQVNEAFISGVGTFEESLGTASDVAPLKSALASSAVLTDAPGTVLTGSAGTVLTPPGVLTGALSAISEGEGSASEVAVTA
jgi:DNA-directed RNA polymerase subunit E'/Rpb7